MAKMRQLMTCLVSAISGQKATFVSIGQRHLGISRNIVFASYHGLTRAYLVAMWTWGLCVMPVTPCGRENTEEPKMHYLSDVANRRPMLRVTGEILLAFGCATPLVLLLSYLI